MAFAGGGGGGANIDSGQPTGPAASGGGAGAGNGAATPNQDGSNASIANRGSGGGGREFQGPTGGTGSSGAVFLRCPGDSEFEVSPPTNTITTLGPGDKLATFTVDGIVKI